MIRRRESTGTRWLAKQVIWCHCGKRVNATGSAPPPTFAHQQAVVRSRYRNAVTVATGKLPHGTDTTRDHRYLVQHAVAAREHRGYRHANRLTKHSATRTAPTKLRKSRSGPPFLSVWPQRGTIDWIYPRASCMGKGVCHRSPSDRQRKFLPRARETG